MQTPYPTQRVQRMLEQLAAKGKDDAQIILDIIDECKRMLEGTNGLDLAFAIDPDEDDILNGVVDDAMSAFLDIFIKRAGTFENLYWHINPMALVEGAFAFYHRMNGAYPKKVYLHWEWEEAMHHALGLVLDGQEVEIVYTKANQKGKKLKSEPRDRLQAWAE